MFSSTPNVNISTAMIALLLELLVLNSFIHNVALAFVAHISTCSDVGQSASFDWALKVSELHIPGYRETKQHFILNSTLNDEIEITQADYSSLLPFENGHLIHKTNGYLFTPEECANIVLEAEEVAARMGWTTTRHGNYPTTDIPIVELPKTLHLLKTTLQSRIYPLLRHQFSPYLPDGTKLRVADGFIVKYDAAGGQSELKPHRDGSVLSFNVALNDSTDYEGGGTWFRSLNDSIRIEKGEVVSHASGILHGGHGIRNGRRYIMVCFVILEGYDTWSMRFYNNVRDL
jgi:hypothetical protein